MSRRPILARALLAVGLAAAVPLVVPPSTVDAAPAPVPRTGFEQRAGASWTTLAEEQAFLRAVDARSDRVRISRIGETTQGRPLQLVQLGAPAPPPAEVAATGRVLFFVCSQHGDEPSGREACLRLLRDLAFTADPRLLAQLRDTTVLFLPTANPDGRAADTRENAAGVDVNRDHLVLQTPEAQAVARVFRDWRPDLVHDLHEYGPDPGVYDRQLIYLWPRNLNVDDRVHDLSEALSLSYVGPAARAAGYSTGIYGIWYRDGQPIAQVAGDEQERILRNLAGLRHSLGILVEANNAPTIAAERADVRVLNRRRVDSQVVAELASLRLLRDRAAAVQSATEASVVRAVEEGRSQTEPVFWRGADNDLPDSDELTLTPPCGYSLTPEQAAAVDLQLDLHGIRTVPREGRVFVPMAQAAERVIPLLLDERAAYELVAASVVQTCPPDARVLDPR